MHRRTMCQARATNREPPAIHAVAIAHPQTTSVAQWTPRYTRDQPIAATRQAAAIVTGALDLGHSTAQIATSVAHVASDCVACPEGNDVFCAVVSAIEAGGRILPTTALVRS